ncbi:MAG: hypothetical protein WA946_15510 [Nitrospirota bacterium]
MPFPGKPRIRRSAAVLAVFLLIGVILSPRYLVYSDLPRKSDIIIQFVGSDQDARFNEAVLLAQEGYADYLFVPTLFSLYRVNQERTGLTSIWFTNIKPGIKVPQPRTGNAMSIDNFYKIRSVYRIPRFYEDTHAEILLAKRAMDTCGFRRAIFVSSPYHMRRIKIITGTVFDPSYDIELVPSRFEKRFEAPLPSQKDIHHVFTEFPKMAWFLSYGLWNRSNGPHAIKTTL